MEELISVIVPIYKVQDYLDRCIQSLVNQTYKNLEIILVDDDLLMTAQGFVMNGQKRIKESK